MPRTRPAAQAATTYFCNVWLALLALTALCWLAAPAVGAAEAPSAAVPPLGAENLPGRGRPAAAGEEPASFFSLYYAGALALDRKQYDFAISALRQAIALRPDFAESYCELGIAELGLKRPRRAIAALKQSLALGPSYASRYMARFSLGEAYQLLGLSQRAAAAYQSALRLHGNLAVAHKRLAEIYLTQQQRARTIAAYWSYVAFAPAATDAASIARRARSLQEEARRAQPAPGNR
ncbi:MAG: tetratricopeptide repeat protein [Candidatus Tectomicrobia bacterium]|nr:tetratricopeptide repeat protein [Candidatus Tectomicrobia bacterium]